MKQKKFIIIDGNSLANRAFYAIPLLSNKQGVITNAVYGFTNMLVKLLNEENPDYFAVAFDKSRQVFRHKKYEDYKGQRKGMPEELRSQMPLIKEVLKAMNIAYYEQEGFEADDLIGTMVKWAENKAWQSIIITGDRDALQLVSPQTKVMLTKRGITNIEINDEKFIKEKYNLLPAQIIDLKGLMGDAADNIPGVPGIGKKTALKLLYQYESMENIYKNLEDFKGKKLGENLIEFKEQAFMSKDLATIFCKVEMDLQEEYLLVKRPNKEKLLELYKELEFKNLYQNLLAEAGDKIAKVLVNREGQVIENLRELKNILAEVDNKLIFFLDLQESRVKGVALYINKKSYYVKIRDEFSSIAKILKPIIENKKIAKITYDVKQAYMAFKKVGIELQGLTWDVLLAAYLLDPSQNDLTLPTLISRYLNIGISEEEDNKIFIYISQLENLANSLVEQLEDDDLISLYLDMELPLATVLAKMELQGVKLDARQLKLMGRNLEKRIDELTKIIYQLAGQEFNINSPKQLGIILFEELGLPVIKRTKTGYSTNAEVLETLEEKHEIIHHVLNYRQLVKLKGTYVDGLLSLIHPKTRKVHTSFNQTITATGRLSSTEPNLQNIPIRLEEGRKIRKAFVPSREGFIFLTADYSQIELRVLAHVAQDQVLMEAFREGQDIHARTAAEILGISIEEVNAQMRRHAKAINFGIVYGLSDFGLAKDLGISRKEAKSYIDNYFVRYAGVKNWIDEIIASAREKGYVETLLGRRRYLRDILSKNFNLRKFAERTAMNTPIQGSAADIIKLAMLKIDEQFTKHGFASKMILQVHDELVFEVAPNESSRVVTIVRQAMEEAYPLQVPLIVDMQAGFNWYELESI